MLLYDMENGWFVQEHLQTGLKQFPDPIVEGARAALLMTTAKEPVIVGGIEQRCPEKTLLVLA